MDQHQLESFALASDRAEALDQLVPGTEDYYFHRCLLHEQRREWSAVADTLRVWIDRHGPTARVTEIRHRLALLRYEEDPVETREYLRTALDLRFDHAPVAEGQEARYPTTLDPARVAREAVRRQGLTRSQAGDLAGFTDAALPWLVHEPLEGERLRHLLGRLRRPDHEGLALRVLAELDDRGSRGFGSLPIHHRLLRDQLDQLIERRPQLLDVDAFVEAYLVKLWPGPDVDWEHDPAQHEAFLDRMWTFVAGLGPRFGALRAHLLYHRLELDRSRGIYDRDRLLAYLRLPRKVPYARPDYLQRFSRGEVRPFELGSDYRNVTDHAVVRSDEALVRDHLEHLLRDEDDLAPWAETLRTDFLHEVFATAKILAGVGDLERWTSMLDDPGRFAQLKERVELRFAPQNPRWFRADDPVTLTVDIKNVPTLELKIFEINTLNYHLVRGGEVDTSIDLDGLVASESQVHELSEPPLRRVRRTFALPTLSRPGVYVVELIGGGVSSRALVCKGRLRVLERIGAAGHVFTVLDEQGRPLPDATLWLGGAEYRPDAHGAITVPFSTRPRRETILLRHGDLTTVETFHHRAEHYRLAASFYVDRESLLPDQPATVLVRAWLLVNGIPASPALLESPTLVIRSTDHDGVGSTLEVSPWPVHEDRESTHTFTVPPRLRSVTFTLRGKVRALSSGERVEVQSTRTFELNAVDGEAATRDLHLARTEAGYVLYLLGRSGEPRADVPLHLRLTHRDLHATLDVMLQTDVRGRVALGHLRDLTGVQAVTPRGRHREWILPRDHTERPRSIHAATGETIRVPVMDLAPLGAVGVTDAHGAAAADPVLARGEVSLLERIANTFVRDRFDALRHRDGFLEIEGLDPGDYELWLGREDATLTLHVVAGEDRGAWVVGARRHLERSNPRPLQICGATSGPEGLRIQLRHADARTRVHVFGTRLVPAYTGLRSPEVRPRVAYSTKTPSHYVSGRDLGDEHRYILERRRAEKFPGVMLTRPGLLLAPWAVRGTETDTRSAAAGGAYAASSAAPPPAARPKPAPAPAAPRGGEGPSANLDFLAHPAAVQVNLRPDDRGIVTVSPQTLAHANQLRIVAVGVDAVVQRDLLRPEVDTAPRDLRLAHGLDPAVSVAQQRRVTVCAEGEALEIADITTSKVEVYDTLARVYRLLSTLSGDATLAEFGFVLQWPTLPEDQKRARYSEYACHELNLLLSRKDPEFFERVIVPHLRHKKHRTFLDHYLLGDDLSAYLRPWAHGRLNILERILLAQRIEGQADPGARHIADLDDLRPRDVDRDTALFRAALGGAALESDDPLGFGAAVSRVARQKAEAAESGLASPAQALLEAPEGASRGAPRKRKGRGIGGQDPQSEASELFDLEVGAAGLDEDEDERMLASHYGGGGRDRDLAAREQQRRLFVPPETTQEWAENNYYHRPIEQQGPDLLPVNPFWRDFAAHRPPAPFVSPHVAHASGSFCEMMCALAVLDLPFEAEAPQVTYDGATMTLRAASRSIVVHEQILPTTPHTPPLPILVSQSYLRHDDRHRYEGGETHDKVVTGELLVDVVYTCKVVLTNPTGATHRLELLLQIPTGAVPVAHGFVTRGQPVELSPQSTRSLEYSFYFPAPGTFEHFAAHVTKDGQRVAAAEPRPLTVVVEPSEVDRSAWAWVSQHGTPEEVLGWLDAHNLDRLGAEPGQPGLARIAWRMKDREFYEPCLTRLEQRHVYHRLLWSYAVYHDDAARMSEFLLHEDDFVDACGLWLQSPLLRIDPVARRRYQHLEYAPLVNARAHRLGARHEILNRRFAAQYDRLMRRLCYQPTLGDDDRLAVAYALLLADRPREALEVFDAVSRAGVETAMQYDYLQVYARLLRGQPQAAREVAEPYRDYPVDRWRNLFAAALAQLDELQGARTVVVDDEDRQQQQAALADTEPDFDLVVERDRVTVTYHNLEAIEIGYYLMDIELLFSRQPFVQQQSEQFSFIEPNRSERLTLPPDRDTLAFDLPADYRGTNLVVELRAQGRRRQQAYFAHALALRLTERYGQLRVTQREGGQPLPRTYVKVYARMVDGTVRFYKDGYTDLRGRFDYASRSTHALDRVERLSMLVMSPEHGAVIREVAPPER